MYRKSKRKKSSALQLCYVCLSSDRTLTVFGKLKKVFQQITNALDLKMVPTSLLCWECIALLKKVYWFKERAKKSQILLSSWDSSKTTLETQSNLRVVAITTTSSHAPIEEADVLLGENEIKIEIDLNLHLNDTIDHNNDKLGDDCDEMKMKTDHDINDALADDKDAFDDDKDAFDDDKDDIFDDKDALCDDQDDVFSQTDYDDDTEMNIFKEIDEKKPAENVNDEDFKKNTVMEKDGSNNLHKTNQEDDPDYECPKFLKSQLKNSIKMETSTRIRYKLLKRNSLACYTKKIPITMDEVIMLWGKDRDSEYFRSLKNKCDICLIKIEEGLAAHKQKVHLQPFSAMDFSSQINKTINWDDCLICQSTKEGQRFVTPTEHSFLRFKESLTVRKMYEDTQYVSLYYLLDGFSADGEMRSKIKWHKDCYSLLAGNMHIERTKKNFEKRRALETSEKQYYCNICKSYMEDEKKLSSHMERHCVKYQCKICGFETLLSHAITHHFNYNHARIVECLECGAQFGNPSVFQAHFADLHVKFMCDHCGKKFHLKRSLVKHIQRNHTPRLCKPCNKVYKNERLYKQHVDFTHTVEKSEATYCVTCNIHFDNMKLFERHCKTAAVHLEEMGMKKEKVKCPECPKIYNTKTSMMNHYQYVHLKNSKYYCSICNQQFLSSTRYNDHRKSKHDKNYVVKKNKLCSYCGRGFSDNKILINHIRTHTGERPFVCSQCDSKFTQKQALVTHVRHVHMKIKRGK